MPKIQIVIPAINLWNSYTKPCLDSIKTKYEYRILLIDNASSDETKEEAGKLVSNNFEHKRNEESWSCAKSWNYGIKDAFERGFDYVLILNNDILLHPEAIDKLVERFEQDWLGEKKDNIEEKNIGNLAMVTCMDIRNESDPPESFFNWKSEIKAGLNESEHPNFSAFMINKECIDKVGYFDEGFEKAYFEDNDFHYRINLEGMKAICLPTAMFYHFGSRTQNEAIPGQYICNGEQFEKNKAYFIKKWGGVPGLEKFNIPFNEI